MEFRQAVAETGPFGRRCLSILPCSPFPLEKKFFKKKKCDRVGKAFESHPDGLAVPHAILVAGPLANRRAFQPFHCRP